MSGRTKIVATVAAAILVLGVTVGAAASAAGGRGGASSGPRPDTADGASIGGGGSSGGPRPGAPAASGASTSAGGRTSGAGSGRAPGSGSASHGPTPVPLRPGPAVIPDLGSDSPDPFILPDGGGYYLYSSEVFDHTAPVMVSYTTQFGHWPAARAAMVVEPAWATPGFTWAPDVRRVGDHYVMYYDALARPDVYTDPAADGLGAQAQCIGTAVATSPTGPFVPAPQALVCQLDHHGSIDPRSLTDPSGRLWLVWKSDDNADFSVARSPVTHIFSQRLAPDGLSLVGARTQLLQADEPWQHGIVEAPQLVLVSGQWWLFYSGGWFNQPYYAVGVARCAGPSGPCTDLDRNPILASNSQGLGPGEESLVRTTDASWWMVYSPWAWGPRGVTNRPLALAQLDFSGTTPRFQSAAVASGAIGPAPPA